VHKFKLIIYNLQSLKSGFGVSRTMEGRPSPKTSLLLQGRPLHRSIDSACVLEKTANEKHAYFHKSLGKIKGRKSKLLKHVFALYNLPIIFSKNFRLHFIPHLKKCKQCNVLYQPYFIFFFIFGVIFPHSKLQKFT